MDEKKLAELLQAALQPIQEHIKEMRTDLNQQSAAVQQMRTDLNQQSAAVQQMHTEMNQQFEVVKASINRIEENQPHDIKAILERIYSKLED